MIRGGTAKAVCEAELVTILSLKSIHTVSRHGNVADFVKYLTQSLVNSVLFSGVAADWPVPPDLYRRLDPVDSLPESTDRRPEPLW